MSRPGLKYVSPGERSIPAVNSGRWNRATNYAVDLARVLGDVGIKPNDTDTVELFLRYVTGGRFLCAAKRKRRKASLERSYEALWMFIPDDCGISPQELADIIEQLPLIFGHKEAFLSPEGFEDILPGVFFEKENEVANPEKPEDSDKTPVEEESDKDTLPEMTLDSCVTEKVTPKQEGWRVGYVNLECREDLETVLGCGYKRQYENFGLILLCDNPVRVESILPRIFLPELALNRQLRELKEESDIDEQEKSGESGEYESALEMTDYPSAREPENTPTEDKSREEPPTEKSEEEGSGLESEEDGKSGESVRVPESGLTEELESAKESEEPSKPGVPNVVSLSDRTILSGEGGGKAWKLDLRSFGIGFLVALSLFLIIMLMR